MSGQPSPYSNETDSAVADVICVQLVDRYKEFSHGKIELDCGRVRITDVYTGETLLNVDVKDVVFARYEKSRRGEQVEVTTFADKSPPFMPESPKRGGYAGAEQE